MTTFQIIILISSLGFLFYHKKQFVKGVRKRPMTAGSVPSSPLHALHFSQPVNTPSDHNRSYQLDRATEQGERLDIICTHGPWRVLPQTVQMNWRPTKHINLASYRTITTHTGVFWACSQRYRGAERRSRTTELHFLPPRSGVLSLDAGGWARRPLDDKIQT